ncbi:hypothetical protein F5Y12DRAFT_778629 [Xylaria sp. FL1777]|nr:hypothetical protein F5Y12DRAFT_778629 [Xylaria sp. FL1777]
MLLSMIALAGNAFLTTVPPGATEVINKNGLANWMNPNTVCSVYFRVASAAQISVGLKGYLADNSTSTVRVTINETPFTIQLTGTTPQTYPVGTVMVPAAGYVTVALQGISKSGGVFGNVSDLSVTTTAALTFANDPANYYWSRRGPSVYMFYKVPANSEYFYNEVTVPEGADAIGSYFMVAGFTSGYSGIQVNSATERRVLFSVWDADDGQKTTLVSKGADVVTRTFGGEGTGGQAYLVFNWKAGTTYKFATRIRPETSTGSTLFSVWIITPETDTSNWRYIATWKRPATTTYQSGVYSFLENFVANNGYVGRRVQYGNQWAQNTNGTLTEITTGHYAADATANNAQRMDYAGGLQNGQFWLRNCGFFADYVPPNQYFTRPPTGRRPWAVAPTN